MTIMTRVFAAALLAATSLSAARAADAPDAPSLAGKRIGITTVGTSHYWDLKAYQAQVAEVKRLGGTPIALDAGRDDKRQIAQIQTLIAQQPDAIIEELGNATVLEPWLRRIRSAGIPLFTVDTVSPSSINDTTSDNHKIGRELAEQLVSDLHGHGRIVVFNGFYSVPVCAIRYDELQAVLKQNPGITVIQPELREVIPNTVQNAYGQISEILSKYPEKGSISAVWSAWDIPQIGATQALEAAQRNEVKTYGVDGSPEAVQMLENPNSPAAAIVAQQPSLIGKTAVDNAARYLAGDRTLPRITPIDSRLVTKANAAEVRKQLGQGS
jgi:ribose transport system substrate-binding protein